ncbi:hypothetical protein ACWM35_00630 [Neobacillus sp. K501]
MNKLKNSKHIIYFFGAYFLLMISLIFFAVSYDGAGKASNRSNEVTSTFNKEMKLYEDRQVQKEFASADTKDRWKPSNPFIISALTLASVLDVVIILIWAKKRNKGTSQKYTGKRLTDHKWFWNLIAMGIVQPEQGKMVLKWRNMLLFIILMAALKYFISRKLDCRESALQQLGI